MQSKQVTALVIALMGQGASSVNAQHTVGTFEMPPAPDKELLAKIEALPDNTWMKLPAFKTAGDLTWLKGNGDHRQLGPTVRDYCNRIVWAPERKRGLYCGAGHNIHPLNDVWEYDLASNTWICLYAPDPAPPRDSPEWYRKNVVLRDGVVVTPRGAPVRPAHTWWGLAYDTDKRRLIFWDAHKGIMFSNHKQLAEAVGLTPNGPLLRLSGSGPGEAWVFTFDPESREWKDVLTKAPKAYESSELEYLPDRKALWLHSGKTYLLEAGAREWTTVAPKGPPSGVVSAYDPATRTIVSAGRRAFEFSCDKEQWSPQAELPDGDHGVIPWSMMCFDSAANRFVLCTAVSLKDKSLPRIRLYLYDLKEKTWTRPAAQGDLPTTTNFAGYYDPERNVSVVYSNRDMWVYRCKKK